MFGHILKVTGGGPVGNIQLNASKFTADNTVLITLTKPADPEYPLYFFTLFLQATGGGLNKVQVDNNQQALYDMSYSGFPWSSDVELFINPPAGSFYRIKTTIPWPTGGGVNPDQLKIIGQLRKNNILGTRSDSIPNASVLVDYFAGTVTNF